MPHSSRLPSLLCLYLTSGRRPPPSEGSSGSPGVASEVLGLPLVVLPRAVWLCGREAWCSHPLGRSHKLVTRPKV